MSCQICDYAMNWSTRKRVVCPYCEFDACRTCCETYILGESSIKCMSPGCGREWTRQFISTVFTGVFLNGPLKSRREELLFDNERALLPATQPLVERAIQVEHGRREMAALNERIRELSIQTRTLATNIYRLEHNQDAVVRAEFVRACSAEGCRGFLSTQWKCGICEQWACPTCHVIKGDTRDAEHTCNPDDVATAALLASDTKNCPSCHMGIFKVDGCFARDTPILMWDGSQKASQDIIVGDVLIGDDGEQRIVEHLVSGEDNLYEIKQKNGMSYTVNSKHTLALKYTGETSINWVESLNSWKIIWFDVDKKARKTKQFRVTDNYDKDAAMHDAELFLRQLNINDVIQLTVEDYLTLDNSAKKNLFGFKSSSGIKYPEQNILLDPYILGLWLGDGTHTHPVIASNDVEIRDYINNWCTNNDAELVKEGKYKYRIRRKGYSFGRETVDGVLYDEQNIVMDKTNPFTNSLKRYNLLGNKHIPQEFMINSRDVRLKLLAGIIDTDGHVPKDQEGKRVVIIQSNDTLSKQIIFLARSLGFVVNFTIRERKNIIIFDSEAKDYKDQYVINISGEKLGDIPTILPRKKCVGTASNKDYFRTGIEVTYVCRDQYYGWSINDNKRFLLSDFTVARNCDQMWCTQCHTAFNWRTGRIEQVVHNPHYFEWLRRNGNEVPRAPGDNPCQNNEFNHRTYIVFQELLRGKHAANPLSKQYEDRLSRIVRNVIHMRYVIMNQYTAQNRVQRNEGLRIQYMRNWITEDHFKTILQREDKKEEKKREVRNVLDILYTTCTDIVLRFIAHLREAPAGQWTHVILDELVPIVDYANECFRDIGRIYKCKVLTFNYDMNMS